MILIVYNFGCVGPNQVCFIWLDRVVNERSFPGETLRKKQKRRRRLFTKSVFQSPSPDGDTAESRMTKSLNECDNTGPRAGTPGEGDTPSIMITDAEDGGEEDRDNGNSDDRETVATALSQTLSRCFISQSDSISSSVYILGKGKTRLGVDRDKPWS